MQPIPNYLQVRQVCGTVVQEPMASTSLSAVT